MPHLLLLSSDTQEWPRHGDQETSVNLRIVFNGLPFSKPEK